MISLTRRYRFSASHRLHITALADEENFALFGKCNNPFGHGHDYALSVTVAGRVNAETGLIIDARCLDELIRDNVLRIFAHSNMNFDVPQLANVVPTTENVALVISDIVEEQWLAYFPNATSARVSKVHLQETDRNGFAIDLAARSATPVLLPPGMKV